MSSLSVVLHVLPLAAALALAAHFARSAASRWSAARSGRPYELPENYRPALRRAFAAVLVLAAGIAVTAVLPRGPLGLPDPYRAGHSAAAGAARAAPAPPPGSPARPRRHRHAARPAARRPLPPRPSASASPADASAAQAPARTIALPAGGSLQLLADGTRVWLPPQYAYPKAAGLAFPVVVAYLPAALPGDEELYPAFARQVELAAADPFVVVQPASCAVEPLAAVREAAGRYRLLDGADARGVLGVGPLAPCAVRAALGHPEVFGAYVGVSGAYGHAAVPLPTAPPAVEPRLLLTSAYGEQAQRRSAYALRTALRGLGVRPRIVDGQLPDPLLGGGGRRRELAVAAQYLTEQLIGPARVFPR